MSVSGITVGRLTLGVSTALTEPTGDPVGQQGGAVVPAPRTAPQATLALGTLLSAATTVADAQTLRRQLRSALNNTPLKLGMFLYVVYPDDEEQNGWYVPDQSTLAGTDAVSWLAGLWVTGSGAWWLGGRQRTHREARQMWLKTLTGALYPRDVLGWILSTDFSALPVLNLSVLPNGATSASDSVTGGVLSGALLPAGRDAGQCVLVEGLSDLTTVAYERAESALNLSDVIVYDRRGQITAPSTGPDTDWQEVYGPDWPWNWQTSGQPNDAPVLDNGLVRVRYDASTGEPGFRVDVWSGSAYVEQGKLTVFRIGDSSGYCNTFVSAGILAGDNGGWTPERCVVRCVLAESSDAYSREEVFITVQRGWLGARFEVYPAPKANGTSADARLIWTPNGPDAEDTIMFEPSTAQPPAAATDSVWSTVSSNWTSAAGTFSSTTANFLSVLRCIGGTATVGPWQVNLSVVQQSLTFAGFSDSSAYGGSAQNAVYVQGAGGMGYTQLGVSFVATQADQVQTGTLASWSSSQASDYRVFQYAGSTPVWSDVGEYTGTALALSSAAWAVAFQTEDRTRAGALYGGARDAGQAAL
ncbi:MAG: hypothetical protein ACYCQK_01615, partial [Acidiferrobacteraceae bacterium]